MSEPSRMKDPKKNTLWKWLLFLILLIIAGIIVFRVWGITQKKSNNRQGRGDIPVQVSLVILKPITYTLVATGDIMPLMQVDLLPKVSGYLEKVYVHMGDSVKQGQVIAQIDRTDFIQKVKEVEAKMLQAKANLSELQAGSRPEELRQAEETVRQAQSRFDNSRFHRERVEALYKMGAMSKKESDIAEMEYKVTEAQLASSQQNLSLLKEGARQEVREVAQGKLKEMEALLAQERIRLQNTEVMSPFPGEIIRRYVEAGTLVSSSTALVTLAHTETLKVVANILEKDIPLVAIGMKATVKVEAYPEKIFEGKVTRMNKALDAATRTLQLEIYISNSQRILKPGMFARVEMVLSEKPKAIVIPKIAVIEEGGSKYIFVVQNNQAIRKTVITGYEQDQFIEILQGVEEGERVIIKGQASVRDRSPVRLIEGG